VGKSALGKTQCRHVLEMKPAVSRSLGLAVESTKQPTVNIDDVRCYPSMLDSTSPTYNFACTTAERNQCLHIGLPTSILSYWPFLLFYILFLSIHIRS
jgi:hypothetical protein